MRLIQAEIDQEIFLHGLGVVAKERRHIGIAPKEPEGVTLDEVG